MYVPSEPDPISTDTGFKTVLISLKGIFDASVFDTYIVKDGSYKDVYRT
jgi:hypothetical protein